MSFSRIGLPILTLLALIPAAAAAQNNTVAGSLALYPTYEAVGVRLGYSGDANQNASARLEWRPQGSSTWKLGVAMTRISNARWAGSVLWLRPDTPYEVRAVITDPDGGASASGATRTRQEPAPAVTGRQWWVATQGSDGNAGTAAAPLATLQGAADRAQPGDEIRVKPGIYYQTLDTPRAGSAAAWIQLVADGPGVIVDGADPAYLARGDWRAEGGGVFSLPYSAQAANRLVVVDSLERLYKQASLGALQANANGVAQGFAIEAGRLYVKLENGQSPLGRKLHVARANVGLHLDQPYWRVSGLQVRHFGMTSGGCGIQLAGARDCWVADNQVYNIGGRPIFLRLLAADNLVEKNHVRDPRIWTWPWAAVKAHEEEITGISNRGGRGNVIRRNTVQGTFNGIDVRDGESDENVGADTDLYANTLSQMGDDAFETDVISGINVRIWKNRVDDVFVGMSIAPISQGPEYILYNTFTHYWRSAFKLSLGSTGHAWICHNTMTSARAPSAAVHPSGPFSNLHFRNNILVGTNRPAVNDDAGESQSGNDFEGDLIHVNSGALFRWKNTNYATLPALRFAIGFELGGRQGDPLFSAPGSGDYSIRLGSPAIDAGIRLFGINDSYLGLAPDIGAFEAALSGGSDVLPPAAIRDLTD